MSSMSSARSALELSKLVVDAISTSADALARGRDGLELAMGQLDVHPRGRRDKHGTTVQGRIGQACYSRFNRRRTALEIHEGEAATLACRGRQTRNNKNKRRNEQSNLSQHCMG